ncbi:MAG: methyltransferase [Verrucomicrobiota bacterium]
MPDIRIPDNPPTPQALIPQLTLLPLLTQAIGTVAELGVADHIGDEPVSTRALAEAVGADPTNLRRCLRVLAATGLFKPEPQDSWSLTAFGQSLKTDSPQSTRYMSAVLSYPFHWLPFGRFADCIKTGQAPVKEALGMDMWSYLEEHPSQADHFSKAMAEITASVSAPMLELYDFSHAKTIVDVAGAYGALLAAILNEYPTADGVLFDMPHIVAEANKVLGQTAPRVTKVGGSFFEDDIPVGDQYLLKHILHDWPDAEALKILQGIRRAMPHNARLLVIEMIMPDEPSHGAIALLDLAMMVLFGGKERTEAEYEALLNKAGLRLERTIPTGGLFSLLEAVPD